MSTSVVATVNWSPIPDHDYLVEIREGGNIVDSVVINEEAISWNGATAGFNLDKGIGGDRELEAHVIAIRQFDEAQSLPAVVGFTVEAYDEPAPDPPSAVTVNVV